MNLIAAFDARSEAVILVEKLDSIGVRGHLLEQASANVRVSGIPVSYNIMVSDEDFNKAQNLVQDEFPAQRSPAIRLCKQCRVYSASSETFDLKLRGFGKLMLFMRISLTCKSYCSNCRNFY